VVKITTHSPEQTIALGRRIGEALRGGEVLAVTGDLGSGKTHLIKGIAAGAGAEDLSRITSPTFVLVNEYAGRLAVYHIDAYRLDSVAEFEALGFDDYCRPDAVVVVEWADKVESALAAGDPVRIGLEHAGATRRTLTIRNAPPYLTPENAKLRDPNSKP